MKISWEYCSGLGYIFLTLNLLFLSQSLEMAGSPLVGCLFVMEWEVGPDKPLTVSVGAAR